MAKYILGDIFKGDFTITQYYGQRPEYYSQFGLKGHEGIDFGTPIGTPILAPFDGKILRDIDDFKSGAYGNFIVVWDPIQKCAVWFCHLNKNSVSVNNVVKKGQVLGETGNSGNTSGPHLHFNFVETDANANRLNTNNGYQGFLNSLDPSLVEWKLGGEQESAPQPGTLPDNFSQIVHGSTQWDKIVKDFNLGNPAEVSYSNVQNIINGYKSRITDLTNQLISAHAEIKNREEQVSRLKQEVLTSEKLRKDLVSKLNDALKQNSGIIGVYEGQIKGLRDQITTLAVQKGDINKELASCEAKIQSAKDNVKNNESVLKKMIDSLIDLFNIFKK